MRVLIANLDLKYLASLILPRSFVCVGVGILFVVLCAFCWSGLSMVAAVIDGGVGWTLRVGVAS